MTFSGKLLLFGEHSVLRGSAALAMPLPLFSGHWAFASPENAAELQRNLPQWCQYLTEQRANGKLEVDLDLSSFATDLQAGLYFDSNIPNGYGAGSSGALCVALYTRYALTTLNTGDAGNFPKLKRVLGQLESFFHGSSSGTDPLIIYLNRPILLQGDGSIQTIEVPGWPGTEQGYQFFLIDSGIQRSTATWVNLFLDRCNEPGYLQAVQSVMNPLVAQAIESFRAGNWEALFIVWSKISAWQLEHLAPFIPANQLKLWQEGLHSQQFTLKLCGAGGGGFLLGMGKSGAIPAGAILLKTEP